MYNLLIESDEELRMNKAQQLKRDYRGHLDMMLAEAKVWGTKELVMAYIGGNEFPVYTFTDGSSLEFKVRHDFAHEVRLVG